MTGDFISDDPLAGLCIEQGTEGLDRRQLLLGGLSSVVPALAPGIAAGLMPGVAFAQAQSRYLFDLRGDDGSRVVNYAMPAQFSARLLPGILWIGPASAKTTILEFFDYNCPYCARADRDLWSLAARDRTLRIGLVNNAVLSLGSFQAARVQQAVLRLYGQRRALQFHRRLYRRRGQKTGLMALAVARSMKLNMAAVEKAADSKQAGNVVVRQTRIANSLGFNVTPSFIVNKVGVLGYPGPKALRSMIAAVRACNKLACG